MSRDQSLAILRERVAAGEVWDALIVGGGINGIGVFRDLALQGCRVLLLERGDFCSGASAASSHMVHGGLRYLENGEFRLVREALRERNLLLAQAPHQVRPLQTVAPIFKRFSGLFNAPLKFLGLLQRPAERGALVIKLGLALYDRFANRSSPSLPRHSFHGRDESLRRYPALNPRVLYTASYYDGAMATPERLGLEVMLNGVTAGAGEAQAFNYMSLQAVEKRTQPVIRDELNGEEFRVPARVIVNAAGPWIDEANTLLRAPTEAIGGSKGSHIVLRHPALRAAIGDCEFFFENRDGRIVLLYPWFDRVLVGTSDIPIEHPDEARCTDAEIDYFLEMIDIVFPNLNVQRSDIVFQFSGVRPLPRSTKSRSGRMGQVSRDHSIHIIEGQSGEPPVLSLVGGKWTTFRAFAERATDETLARLNMKRSKSTATLPVAGGDNFPKPQQRKLWLETRSRYCGVPVDQLELLLDRYGGRAMEVARYVRDHGCDPLGKSEQASNPWRRGELVYILRQEHVTRLDDLLLRRTTLGMQGLIDRELLAEAGDLAAMELDWDQQRLAFEIERTRGILRDRHGVDI